VACVAGFDGGLKQSFMAEVRRLFLFENWRIRFVRLLININDMNIVCQLV